MQALRGGEVSVALSLVSSLARSFFGSAAAQPQQARGEDAAHLPEVRREVVIGRVRQGHRDPTRMVLPVMYGFGVVPFSRHHAKRLDHAAVCFASDPNMAQTSRRRRFIVLSSGTLPPFAANQPCTCRIRAPKESGTPSK